MELLQRTGWRFSGEDDALGLLQRRVVKTAENVQVAAEGMQGERRELNATKVWEELKIAVLRDKLVAKEHVEAAKNSTIAQKLQEKINELQQNFPSSEQIKESFKGQWQNITEAVQLEGMQKKLDKMKDSEAAEKLRERVESLKARMGNVTVDSVKAKARDTWERLQSQGKSLPDLDEISDKAGDIANGALNTVRDAWNSSASRDARHTVGHLANQTWDGVKDVWNSSAVRDARHGVGNVAHSVGDTLHDWFHNWHWL